MGTANGKRPFPCWAMHLIARERAVPYGSSRRVRGTRQTAACSSVSRAVHPRVCGERVSRRAAVAAFGRFIPACAGNAVLPGAGELAQAAGGEAVADQLDADSGHARIPLVLRFRRGAVDSVGRTCRGPRPDAYVAGSIPAGSAPPSSILLILQRAQHEREAPAAQVGLRVVAGSADGSSPRVRGTRRMSRR